MASATIIDFSHYHALIMRVSALHLMTCSQGHRRSRTCQTKGLREKQHGGL